MGCRCATCETHWRALDLSEAPASTEQLREAYLDAVKVWHPDRFEGDARLRAKAEARFKGVQVAYRELQEHFAAPAQPPAPEPTSEWARAAAASYDAFAGDDRCYVSPNIPESVRNQVGFALGAKLTTDLLVVIDLSGSRTTPRDLSMFLMLSTRGLTVHAGSVQGFLPYLEIDPARLTLEDHERTGFSGWWPQGLDPKGGRRPRYSLEIYRRNGDHVFKLDTPVTDTVKQALHAFLKARTR